MILYKNVKLNYDGVEKITNLLYKEELIEDNCFLMLILWISAVWKGTTVILSMQNKK
jgi:hypothetical protein